MTCVDYTTWMNAKKACANKLASVKGFGYVSTGRSLGFSVSATVSPASIIGGGAGQQAPMQTMVPLQVTAPAYASTINTNAIDPTDPCYIASQGFCTCPPGLNKVCLAQVPGSTTPAPCQCIAPARSSAPSSGSATAPASSNALPGGVPVQQANVAAGGFSHWGLLAAVAVGGTALYLVMKKKQAS